MAFGGGKNIHLRSSEERRENIIIRTCILRERHIIMEKNAHFLAQRGSCSFANILQQKHFNWLFPSQKTKKSNVNVTFGESPSFFLAIFLSSFLYDIQSPPPLMIAENEVCNLESVISLLLWIFPPPSLNCYDSWIYQKAFSSFLSLWLRGGRKEGRKFVSGFWEKLNFIDIKLSFPLRKWKCNGISRERKRAKMTEEKKKKVWLGWKKKKKKLRWLH